MDPVHSTTNNQNNEKKSEEVQLLIPNVPKVLVSPMKSDLKGLLKPSEQMRSRRSFCDNPHLKAVRPSAIVSAIQQDRRANSSGNILFEYVLIITAQKKKNFSFLHIDNFIFLAFSKKNSWANQKIVLM